MSERLLAGRSRIQLCHLHAVMYAVCRGIMSAGQRPLHIYAGSDRAVVHRTRHVEVTAPQEHGSDYVTGPTRYVIPVRMSSLRQAVLLLYQRQLSRTCGRSVASTSAMSGDRSEVAWTKEFQVGDPGLLNRGRNVDRNLPDHRISVFNQLPSRHR